MSELKPISDDLRQLYAAQIAAIAARKPQRAPAGDAALRWCLVYSEPGKERLADHWLTKAGYAVFIPTWLRRIRIRKGPGKGKVFEKLAVLFPSYMFVGHAALRFAEIEETKGVIEVVRFDDAPVEIPAAIVLQWKDWCESGCFVEDMARQGWVKRVRPGTKPEELEIFRPGERFRVADGPLIGFHATVESLPQHDHVEVLIMLFGRATRMMIGTAQLEAL